MAHKRFAFACPGAITGANIAKTGGTLYDARILQELRLLGLDVQDIALPLSFPSPSFADLAHTAALLHQPFAALLIDGLAYGALPDALIDALPYPIIALVHHPLFLETGLSHEEQERLFASEKTALHNAAHIITVSETVAQHIVSHFQISRDKITLATPAFDEPMLTNTSANPFDATRYNMLAVGAIIARKGYDVLVKALARAHEDLPANCHLTIIGERGRDEETLQNLHALIATHNLTARIKIQGAVEPDVLSAYYHYADLFVSASRYEGFGMALCEAMAHGLPIITTTGGAVQNTVPDGAALKIASDDVEALVTALVTLSNEKDLQKTLRQNAMLAAQQFPRWEESAKMIADVLNKICL